MKHDEHTIGPDDPRLTAYALGELEGDEAARIEALLATDEAARRAVAELRELGAVLRDELAGERAGALHAEQRARLLSGRRTGRGELAPARRTPNRLRAGALVGVAAAAVLALYGLWREPAPDATRDRVEPFTYSLFGEDARVAKGDAPRPLASEASGVAPTASPASPDAEASAGEGRWGQRGIGVGRRESSAEPTASLKELGELGYAADGPASPQVGTVLERELEVLGHGGGPEGRSSGRERTYVEEDALAPLEEPALDVDRAFDTEAYDAIRENAFRRVESAPLSTFSIDVDTASYANVRRFLTGGELPPPDAVRIEELLNYFRYADPAPTGDAPFSVSLEAATCPWAPAHRLVRIGLKGRAIDQAARPPSNLVFLLDVSGSMDAPNKLALLKRSLRLLVDSLDERDTITVTVYAGAAGVALPPTSGARKATVLEAVDRLAARGSTDGAQGIRLAYRLAREHFVEDGTNRVILATDGDFNVGTTSDGELVRLIAEQAESGVFLSVLGFGTGNYKDAKLEQLADQGNGNYAYVDSLAEARKVLVEELGATLVTIAKDVKLQVEFNPLEVEAWRLIGYENRLLAARDFNDDAVDAGEIGAGHGVTALYEVVPAGTGLDAPRVDALRYRRPTEPTTAAGHGELLNVKLRYKQPDGDASRLLEVPLVDAHARFDDASDDLRFAAAVAAFGMCLRGSEHRGEADLPRVAGWAEGALGADRGGYRAEFLGLVDAARRLRQD